MARFIQMETSMAIRIRNGSEMLRNITANTKPTASMLNSFTLPESSWHTCFRSYVETELPTSRYVSP